MGQNQQFSEGEHIRRWRRWFLLVGGVLATLLIGYVVLSLCRPAGVIVADPRILATIKPGMTRAEIEAALGEPLVPQRGRFGARSNQPTRSFTPGLIEEEGLEFVFDEKDILREAKVWGFVRPESVSERILRVLGL
jgi:hypothetical protein